jgi:hypothetical protein
MGQHIFFEKARDWQSEREYRLMIHSPQGIQPMIPLHGSLKAIVLGEEYPPYEYSVLHARLRSSGLLPLQVFRLLWINGAPRAAPATDYGEHDPDRDLDRLGRSIMVTAARRMWVSTGVWPGRGSPFRQQCAPLAWLSPGRFRVRTPSDSLLGAPYRRSLRGAAVLVRRPAAVAGRGSLS